MKRRLNGVALQPFVYRDFGSLVSLGKYTTVGNLMGAVKGKGLMVEGYFARFMYKSLYKMHQMALFGLWKVLLLSMARSLTSRHEARVKLH